jgi:hypothetical protein
MIGLIFDFIGLVGVFLIIFAYLSTQTGRMSSDQLSYPVINLCGSILVMISLLKSWNFPSFVIELAWIIISIMGIVRCMRNRSNQTLDN